MQKELSLIFTRDFSLFTCDFWHTLMTDVIVRAYGVPFSGQVIKFNGHAIECYRVSDEMRQIKERIVHLPESHSLFSAGSRAAFNHAVRTAREIVEQMRIAPRAEYTRLAEDLLEQWKGFYPHYMLANFLPGHWREDFLVKGEDWRDGVVFAFEHDRHFCEGVFEAADIAVRELVKKSLVEISVAPSYAEFLTWDEVMSLLRDGVAPSLLVLETRTKGYCMFGNTLYLDVSFADLLAQHGYIYHAPQVVVGQKEFKGTVAFSHEPVRGTVHCVFTYDQVGKFPVGSILVAPMTAPEYLPAIRRALAIITDEGGVTCHAAIVARELGKPCIIGTKIATKVLKDGDEVEVDADKGIVRIIS